LGQLGSALRNLLIGLLDTSQRLLHRLQVLVSFGGLRFDDDFKFGGGHLVDI
jgi:hypothetical protein